MKTTLKRLIAAAVAVVSIPGAAFAQQTILQGGPFPNGQFPVYAGQSSSQPVVRSSGGAGGGAVGLGVSEFLQVNRGTGTAPYGSTGSGPLNTHNCMYDGPTTGANHFLCMDSNTQNSAIIATGAQNGATELPFNLLVNGNTAISILPNGTVILPNTPSSNDPYIDVLNYGADPTGSSDSTSAFQQAINAVTAGTVGTIVVPNGTYLVTVSNLVPGTRKLFWQAQPSTIITNTGTGTGFLPGNPYTGYLRPNSVLMTRVLAMDTNTAGNNTPYKWAVIAPNGSSISTSGTCTDGLQEAIYYSLQNGFNLFVTSNTVRPWLPVTTPYGGLLPNNPATTTSGSASVRISLPGSGFPVGQQIEVYGVAATGGISANNINGVFTITASTGSSFTYTANGTASGSTTGGGSVGYWNMKGESIGVIGAACSIYVPPRQHGEIAFDGGMLVSFGPASPDHGFLFDSQTNADTYLNGQVIANSSKYPILIQPKNPLPYDRVYGSRWGFGLFQHGIFHLGSVTGSTGVSGSALLALDATYGTIQEAHFSGEDMNGANYGILMIAPASDTPGVDQNTFDFSNIYGQAIASVADGKTTVNAAANHGNIGRFVTNPANNADGIRLYGTGNKFEITVGSDWSVYGTGALPDNGVVFESSAVGNMITSAYNLATASVTDSATSKTNQYCAAQWCSGNFAVGAVPVLVSAFNAALQVNSATPARIGLHDTTANTWFGVSNNNDAFEVARWNGASWDTNLFISNVGATTFNSRVNSVQFITGTAGSGIGGFTANGGGGSIGGFATNTGSSGSAAHSTVLDNNGTNTARMYSYGADVSTNGLFNFISARSDGTNSITWLATDTAGVPTFGTAFKPLQTVVGSLGTCDSGAKGQVKMVTDAMGPTYLATLVGSGSDVALAVCNGTNWQAH